MDVKAKNSLFKKEFLYFYFDGIAGDWRLSRLKHEKLQQWDSFKTTLVDLPSSNYEVLTNLFGSFLQENKKSESTKKQPQQEVSKEDIHKNFP